MKQQLNHALTVIEGMQALGHIRPEGAQNIATVKTAIGQALADDAQRAPAGDAGVMAELAAMNEKLESLGEHVAALLMAEID
jgi:hypothetical protein